MEFDWVFAVLISASLLAAAFNAAFSVGGAMIVLAATALWFTGMASAEVSIVHDGKASAVVVTAEKPSQVAAYAVEELVSHIEKATGQRLPVAVETSIPEGCSSRIFVGVTQAALKQGIQPDQLAPEESVLRTVGSDLYILGKELSLEGAAQQEQLQVVLEGYEPPFDQRVSKLQITPDPGVIEVNVHPHASWKYLVANTTMLYE